MTPCLKYIFWTMRRLNYKVIELNIVSEETIEEALNTWTAKGWIFEGMHFVVREGSRRPSMAFLTFVQEVMEPDDEEDS